MKYYIGNTDYDWFKFLEKIAPEDINFWQPGGHLRFHVIKPGAPFLFRLKSPINKIAGIGFLSSHSLLPIEFAWEVFEKRNGINSLEDFIIKINYYRGENNQIFTNPIIGCIVLTNPIFFRKNEWFNPPPDWSPNIVQGKTYDTSEKIGKEYWNQIQLLLERHHLFEIMQEEKTQLLLEEPISPQYSKEFLTRVRLGQGAFRILITDAYNRRCTISGERTLPVLEAAHIKPFSKSGPYFISNGLLLRSDLHKLFDSGYLTITDKLKVEISKRIKEEFENGREYYKFHGNSILTLPNRIFDRPNSEYIEWHNNNIFKG